MQKQPALRTSIFALTKAVSFVWLGFAAFSCSDPQASDQPEVEVGKVSEALFVNGDFESGPASSVPSSWTITPFLNNDASGIDTTLPSSIAKLRLHTGGSVQTTTLYSASGAESQPDTALTSAGSLRWPKFGNYAAYVNMNPGNGSNVNSIKQSMVLGVNDVDPYDGKPHIRFAVAPVLENPNHPANQQPYYFIQLTNKTTNTVLFTDFHVSGESGVPWKIANSIYYTDWQLKDVAPTSTQASLGDTVELEIIAAGCQPSGHFGRIYVDGVGPTIPGLSVSATAPDSANSNTDIAYDLVFKNGGTGAAGNVVIDFNTPPSTTFTAVSAPGAVCTTPSVGAAGLVSCTYGLLDIGASNSLRITAHINSGATGIVTAGNYQISAVNAQALLGATVYTNITSGVTYTDVSVTNTNGVGAVNWGQAVTYTITATNRGPAAITNGTLTDTLPNTLTGASWTCAGSGGGSCTAGPVSGNISDTAVNLPVGASVTYTLNASVIAMSNGATRVQNTASFTMPGAMADSQNDDNAAADTDPIGAVYTLTVNKSGNATGTVVSVPNGINCGTACTTKSGTFASGGQLILAATPAANKLFTGWSGGCTGTGNCTITLGSNTTVTATFDSPPPCAADTDCSSTRYCDGTTLTCQSRLPNGSNIPNDTIHSGTCATMGLSCASLLCNSNKCAKSSGAACSANVECASNSCTSGTCAKMPDGAQCGLSSDCTSGSCKSLHCVPSASGCYLDADCTNTQYCNRSTLTCATKLTNGTSIPTDGLHTHICADATAVCQSGQCNGSTITCGAADGGTCSVAGECKNNTCTALHCVPSSNGCWVDSNCSAGNYCNRTSMTCTSKLPAGGDIPTDGLHTGGCSDAAAVCATAQCNASQTTCADVNGTMCSSVDACVSNKCTSGYCVPTSNGCYIDSDCSPGNYCKRSTLTCVSKLAAGTAMPSDGLHTGMCSDAAAVCASGKCNSAVPSCAADNGASCSSNAECENNSCTSSHCVPASNGCWQDSDCLNGYCDRLTLSCTSKLDPGAAIPNDGQHNGDCTQQNAQAVCASGECNTTTKTCASPASTTCTAAGQCVSNTCTSMHCVPTSNGCFQDSDCTDPAKFCDRTNLTCSPKLQAGTPIPNDGLHGGNCTDAAAVCASGTCNAATKTCASADGTTCSGNGDCLNNSCISNHCVPSTSGCWQDGDCASGKFCDRLLLTCKPTLGPGAAIPNDGAHNGSCSPQNAQAVCTSGECNSTTQTCASPTSGECTNANQCVSNTCTSGHCVPSTDGCFIDSDCPDPTKYCNRSNLTCTSKLLAGTVIPNDGLHGGTCTDATAVCRTSKCNTATTSCASDDGTTCNGSADCVNNSCVSSHCVPASNGCWQDSNCANGKFCDRLTLSCKPTLDPGAPIPSDGQHNGNCTQQNAQAVCTSGECNATTHTCASPTSSECTDADQCVSNTCTSGHCVPSTDGCFVDADCTDLDQYCNRSNFTCSPKLQAGTAIPNDGLHGGTCSDASAVCRSGSCNPQTKTCALDDGTGCNTDAQCINNKCTQAHCVPTSGGCWDDIDCDSSDFCDRANLLCKDDLIAGVAIPDDTLHGGGCADAPAVCQSQLCDSQAKTCATADATSCTANEQCVSHQCTSDHCVPTSNGCWIDSDCPMDKYCDRDTLTCAAQLSAGTAVPDDGLHDGECDDAVAVCVSDKCNATTKTCALDNGDSCSDGDECVNNVCTSSHCVAPSNGCWQDSDCPEGFCDRSEFICKSRLPDGTDIPDSDGYHAGTCSDAAALCESGKCNEATGSCASDSNATCTGNAECTNNVCDPNHKCGIADGGNGCTTNTGATLCQSGTCAASGRCVPSGGDGCYADSDCASDEYCQRSSLTCKPKLDDGTAIPSDGLHDGRCTQPNAQAVCVSGGCNANQNTCASKNSEDCSDAKECIRNICGSNNKCGYTDGAGPCTQANAKFVCQSGACSSTGNVCVPALNKSCAADSDCAQNAYCDAISGQCAPDLSNGQTIPSDGLHNGLCTQPNALAVCTSGYCNVATSQCAAPLGAACINATECAANICGDNGKCGRPNGLGPCTSSNATAVCQSASCSLDNTCVEAGHCTIDADCAPDRFCDGATTLCTTRLPPGSPVPNDGDHDGTCPDSGLSPVCASGRCLQDTDRCVVENGADCTDDNQCATNACGSNQKCGLEPEAAGCTPGADPSCQSGVCDNDGVCAEGVTCSSDAECAGDGGFCSDGACLPRLPVGATIPNDALHANTCNDTNAGAVCQSGRCNSTTATCADDQNAACAVPAQCASNICGGNGECGLPDGAGPCTTNDAAERCQSQTCSPNTGTCIAAGGCGSDAECATGKYCNGKTFLCVDTLEPGTELPDDGLHDGLCSSQTARVCQSGGCNSTTNTCALENNESCLGAAECSSNLCGSDGKCGARDGEGRCTPGEASQCRSGTCSASTLVCIPQVDGCASPNDCDADEYCDGATHKCRERKRNGDPLPVDSTCPSSGVTRDCASGLCLQDEARCVAPLGDACTDDVQCRTSVCGENGACGIEEGGTCTPQNEEKCQSQNCGSGGTCDAADSCSEDADCPAGNFCDGVFCHPKLAAGVSVASDALHDGKCTQQNALATCQSGTCNDTTDTCAAAQNAPCDDASACVSNACGADGKCGYNVGEGPCTSLSATTVCRTGLCSVVGVCLPSQTSGCAIDSDCGSDAFCDITQHACAPKLSDGTHLPNDGLHDGKCSLQSGAILCASGLCNAVTDTCARLNGTACSSPTTCVTNVCGQNSLCGYAEGEGTCTADTTKLCQTNRCSNAGVCIRTDDGCAADSDCSSGHYCDPAARSCKAKLAAGAALPNDSLHNGTCSSTLAALVCETGQCNATKKTCAAVNGASCNAAAKCISDACGDNGRCGLAVGESGCTSLNQAQTCQSSYCSASGTCVPPAGCNVDSDCSGGTYCNRTAHVCEALLRDGKQLPKDGLHSGTCTKELATVVCASGMCNSTTDTCAAATSSGCNAATQCVTNVCGDNSQCGLSDGTGPCDDDADCQSGECQVDSGRCVASDNGCTRDEDCAAEEHCNTSALQCEADLDDGTTLPGDSDSGGKCTAEVAKTLCASGVCNPETDQCAAIGGSECSEDSQCAANLCVDGRCGSADGNGQCTQQNAASSCQSGVCQGDLYRCVAAKNGCTADSDCPTGNYCDGKTLACVPRLTAGSKLPSDEMHSAECTEDVAAAVCGSGACNARTNACALVVGEPCQQATDCASNACLDSACVATEKAPPAFRLTGGRCSVAWVQAGSIGPSLALLWLAAIVLRRRARSRPKR